MDDQHQIEDLPARLRAARAALGASQADIAKRLGVAPLTVLRWERGSSSPGTVGNVARVRALLRETEARTQDIPRSFEVPIGEGIPLRELVGDAAVPEANARERATRIANAIGATVASAVYEAMLKEYHRGRGGGSEAEGG